MKGRSERGPSSHQSHGARVSRWHDRGDDLNSDNVHILLGLVSPHSRPQAIFITYTIHITDDTHPAQVSFHDGWCRCRSRRFDCDLSP